MWAYIKKVFVKLKFLKNLQQFDVINHELQDIVYKLTNDKTDFKKSVFCKGSIFSEVFSSKSFPQTWTTYETKYLLSRHKSCWAS